MPWQLPIALFGRREAPAFGYEFSSATILHMLICTAAGGGPHEATVGTAACVLKAGVLSAR